MSDGRVIPQPLFKLKFDKGFTMTLHSAALEAVPLRYNKNSNALSSANPKKALQATVAAIPNTTTVMGSVFRSIFRRSFLPVSSPSWSCCQKIGEPQAGWDRGLGLQAEGVVGGPCLIGLFFKQTIKIKTNV
jgi:hypothetical protein